ncbi:MAG TPA: zinc ribbon domain-containing protein [Pyrinomonadaceae bacterium]|jgi:hypothetical protein|nr:zinc ribbon domain-containing protein [Pyrinomonadaceae bacterium]
MALISCPICAKDVSAQAPSCPNCGHPIAQTTNNPQPIIIEKRMSRAWGLLILLLAVITVAAALTKPSESVLKNALVEKYPLLYGIGFVEEKIGLGNMKYHDYLIFSTFSVDLIGEPERTVAFGLFGKTIVPDASSSLNQNQQTTLTSAPNLTNPPPSLAASNSAARNETIKPAVAATTQPVLSDDQVRQGIQNIRVVLSNEMAQRASDTCRARHPFSRIENFEPPVMDSSNQSLSGEEMTGIYVCHMRGTLAGKNTPLVTVKIQGVIAFLNGVFIHKIIKVEATG